MAGDVQHWRLGRLGAALGLAIVGPAWAAACFVEVPTSQSRADGGAGGAVTVGGATNGGATTGGDTSGGAGGLDGCPKDLLDCDNDGTCETDASSDRDNCGACSHDCLGASCVQSMCQPIELRSGESYPHLLAVDDTHVFWTNGGASLDNGEVQRCNKDGSAPRTLVSNAHKPRGIALHEDYVYWSDGDNGSLHRVPKNATGNQDEQLVGPIVQGNGNGEGDIAVFEDRVVWTFEKGGTVRSANLDGTDVKVLASGQDNPTQVAVLDGQVYFTLTADKVGRVALSGGVVAFISTPSELKYTWGLTAGTDELFFTASDWGAGSNGRLMRVDLSGAPMASDVAPALGARDIAVDLTHIYVASPKDNTLSKVAFDGTIQPLAAGQNNPTGVAIDDDALYWTNRAVGERNGGSIWKVAK